MAGEPVKLGSAALGHYIFQEGSTITISDSGIQESEIKAIWPDGATVMNNIPAAGTTFDAIFGNSYLPSDFKLDRSKDGSVQVEYTKGGAATVTFSFKRPDPNATGAEASRKISLDTVFKFSSATQAASLNAALGLAADPEATTYGSPGFPDPVVSVRYNNPTMPVVGAATYARPGSAQTLGFPTLLTIKVKQVTAVWTNLVTGDGFIVTFESVFAPGFAWQLTGLKAEPQADASFFDVTETWRNFYFFTGVNILQQETVTGGVIRLPTNL